MSEAKECVGGRIVGMPGQLAQPGVQAFPRSALRTLMNPHDARATHFAKAGGRPRTDRTVTGRRPQAYYADEPRPKAGYELTHWAPIIVCSRSGS